MWNLVFRQLQQFIYQDGLQIFNLAVEFLVYFRKNQFVRSLGSTCLDGTGEQLLIYHHTIQWRRSFQRSILHITGFITENGTQQLLFGRRIALTLRSNLTDHNITRLNAGTDADNTILIQIFSSFFAYIRNISRQLFHSTFRFTHFQWELFHMDWGQNIFAYHALVQYNGILIVIAFPWHVSHQKVLTQSQFSLLGRITFRQNVPGFYALAFIADRTKVNRHILVCTTELRDAVFFQRRLETYELFFFRTVVQNTNGRSVHIFNHAITLSRNHRTGILTYLFFYTGTYNRRFATQQRHGLAHHVWTHQRTVRVVMLQERNQRCGNRSNLLRSHVHQIHIRRGNNRIIVILTTLYFLTDKRTVIIQRRITLSDNLAFFLFCCQIFNTGFQW